MSSIDRTCRDISQVEVEDNRKATSRHASQNSWGRDASGPRPHDQEKQTTSTSPWAAPSVLASLNDTRSTQKTAPKDGQRQSWTRNSDMKAECHALRPRTQMFELQPYPEASRERQRASPFPPEIHLALSSAANLQRETKLLSSAAAAAITKGRESVPSTIPSVWFKEQRASRGAQVQTRAIALGPALEARNQELGDYGKSTSNGDYEMNCENSSEHLLKLPRQSSSTQHRAFLNQSMPVTAAERVK